MWLNKISLATRNTAVKDGRIALFSKKVINIAKAHEVYIVLESYTYQNSKRGLVLAGKSERLLLQGTSVTRAV